MKTILIAEDEAAIRLLIATTLESTQFRVVTAEGGDDAVKKAKTLVPDLVVLDWMMPGKTGLDVLRELRAGPNTSHLPVIMVTARTQPHDRNQAAEAGATAYLVKPFSPLELLRTVEQLLEQGAVA